MPQSDFLRAVERSGGLLQKAQNELEQTKRLAGAGDMAGAYESAFAFAARAEQLTLLARLYRAPKGGGADGGIAGGGCPGGAGLYPAGLVLPAHSGPAPQEGARLPILSP